MEEFDHKIKQIEKQFSKINTSLFRAKTVYTAFI